MRAGGESGDTEKNLAAGLGKLESMDWYVLWLIPLGRRSLCNDRVGVLLAQAEFSKVSLRWRDGMPILNMIRVEI